MNALVIALALSQTASLGQQFDLTCTGESVLSRAGRQPVREITSQRYRLDLERMEWCTGDCSLLHDLQDASSHQITFLNSKDVFNVVSRITGEWQTSSGDDRSYSWATTGRCDLAPFSGFPTYQTRF